VVAAHAVVAAQSVWVVAESLGAAVVVSQWKASQSAAAAAAAAVAWQLWSR